MILPAPSPETRRRTANVRHACADTLILQQEDSRVSALEVRTKRVGSTINPAVKAWVDNVVVPALLDQWAKKERPRIAA